MKNKLILLIAFIGLNSIIIAQDSIIVTINFIGGVIRDTPCVSGKELVRVMRDDTISVINLKQAPWFRVKYKETVGYISSTSFNKNSIIDNLLYTDLVKHNPKLARLQKLYGLHSAKRIINGEYWIGMTEDMVISSLGEPENINRTINGTTTYKQYCYSKKNVYLYFENGKLYTIQD